MESGHEHTVPACAQADYPYDLIPMVRLVWSSPPAWPEPQPCCSRLREAGAVGPPSSPRARPASTSSLPSTSKLREALEAEGRASPPPIAGLPGGRADPGDLPEPQRSPAPARRRTWRRSKVCRTCGSTRAAPRQPRRVLRRSFRRTGRHSTTPTARRISSPSPSTGPSDPSSR
jgi:hypothetical protein